MLQPLGNLNLVIFFVGVVARAAWSPACRSRSRSASRRFGYLALTTRTPLTVVVGRMDEGMSHLILLSVPLFVFLGAADRDDRAWRGRWSTFLASLLGHVRGGLQYVLVGAMYLVSGISGSKAADMAAVAPALFPGDEARAARKPGDLVALLSPPARRPRRSRRASC